MDQANVDETVVEEPDAAREPVHGASLSAAALAALALAACGGGGTEGASPSPSPSPSPASPFALDAADTAAARFLLQAQVGTTDADIAAVSSQGPAAWLDAQMALPVAQTAWDWLAAKGYTAIDDDRFYDGGAYAIQFVMAHQLVRQPDTLRKRVALALSELFVVSMNVAGLSWTHMGVAAYWDLLNRNAFGNFRQLLEDVTLNPVMGAWLNTRGNAKEDAASGRVPDENYAREVMQLFTIGLVQLNADGTPRLDGSGKPIPTYTQDDVSNLARVFTGYDFWSDGTSFPSANDGSPRPYPEFARRPMVFDTSRHSTLAASFLGTTVPAGTAGAAALRIALDALFNHANAGPFFARQMIQRLVTGNPSPAYVARVAAKFADNGAGVRGDLKAVWKAILLDDEARGAAGLTSTTFGKLREPMVRAFQWGRSFGADSAAGSWKWSYDPNPKYAFGQMPFGSPSVFNFFRPGYVPPGTALSARGATAPEFQIVNESSVSQWVNQLELWAFLGVYVVWPDKPGYPAVYAGPYPGDGFDIATAYPNEIALVADPVALVKRLNLLLCAGQLSETTQQRIVDALKEQTVTDSSPADNKRWRVVAAISFVMCSPEYLVQK